MMAAEMIASKIIASEMKAVEMKAAETGHEQWRGGGYGYGHAGG